MIVLSIDPGKNAAIAIGEADIRSGQVRLIDLVAVTLPRAVPSRLPHLLNVFEDLAVRTPEIKKATIEHPVPFYENGVISNRKGYETQVSDMRFFQSACQSVFRQWPEEIYPPTWQSKVKIGRGKENSLKTCRFYGIDLDDHNKADAVMIMIYTAFKFGIDPDEITLKRKERESDLTYQRRVEMHRRLTLERGISPAVLRFWED